MKKISILLSSLVGAAGGYLLSNKKLRKELQETKNMQEGLNKVMSHLKKDGKTLGTELQKPLNSAKTFVTDKVDDAKEVVLETVNELKPVSKAKKTTKKTVKAVKSKNS